MIKVYDKAFGGWDWVSNSMYSENGYRIVVGWDNNVVNLMVLNMTRQDMLCSIENKHDKKRVYCSFVYDANTDICYSGLFYTWIKSPFNPQSSVLKKLDRIMANEDFIKTYDQAYAVFHPYVVSDYSPAVLTIPQAMKKKPKAFRFANFITEKPEFLSIVKEGWKVEVNDIQIFKVIKRLRYLKASLKNLSWKNGDVFGRVVHLKKKLQEAQVLVDSHPHNNQVKVAVVIILKEYHEAIIEEEKLLFQKAKVEWLCEGDKNSAYFHKVIKGKRKKNRIQVDDISSMHGIYTEKLSDEEALCMVREVTNHEIKTAMFDIGENKASGPDGYTF
ncbi:hypothetical protein Tco_1537108, partial [Tanacetum coccineum]